MSINDLYNDFAGKPIVDWDSAVGIEDPDQNYRIAITYDDEDVEWSDKFYQFLNDENSSKVFGVIVGQWHEEMTDESSEAVVETLVAAHEKLTNLKAIFIGEMTYEEFEISWINQSNVAPLFTAYPKLEHFAVRGGQGLQLGVLKHEHLQSLIVETGGLDLGVVQDILASDLPVLEHLEIWLGARNYGATTTVADLQPLLSGKLFPRLKYLALSDCEYADELAQALAQAPILDRIRVLDISKSTLGDEGLTALLNSPAVAKLEKLIIRHHFCSDELVEKVKALGIEVDARDKKEPWDWDTEKRRYIAVSE